jgi:hypothetical protein
MNKFKTSFENEQWKNQREGKKYLHCNIEAGLSIKIIIATDVFVSKAKDTLNLAQMIVFFRHQGNDFFI